MGIHIFDSELVFSGELSGIKYLKFSGAVCEEGSFVSVIDNVAGVISVQVERAQRGFSGVDMGVISVRLLPGSSI